MENPVSRESPVVATYDGPLDRIRQSALVLLFLIGWTTHAQRPHKGVGVRPSGWLVVRFAFVEVEVVRVPNGMLTAIRSAAPF